MLVRKGSIPQASSPSSKNTCLFRHNTLIEIIIMSELTKINMHLQRFINVRLSLLFLVIE